MTDIPPVENPIPRKLNKEFTQHVLRQMYSQTERILEAGRSAPDSVRMDEFPDNGLIVDKNGNVDAWGIFPLARGAGDVLITADGLPPRDDPEANELENALLISNFDRASLRFIEIGEHIDPYTIDEVDDLKAKALENPATSYETLFVLGKLMNGEFDIKKFNLVKKIFGAKGIEKYESGQTISKTPENVFTRTRRFFGQELYYKGEITPGDLEMVGMALREVEKRVNSHVASKKPEDSEE